MFFFGVCRFGELTWIFSPRPDQQRVEMGETGQGRVYSSPVQLHPINVVICVIFFNGPFHSFLSTSLNQVSIGEAERKVNTIFYSPAFLLFFVFIFRLKSSEAWTQGSSEKKISHPHTCKINKSNIIFCNFWSGSFFDSSRRGRPPKQGLGELSSYDDFTDDDAVQSKKYRMDEKRSPTPSRDENNGELRKILAFF